MPRTRMQVASEPRRRRVVNYSHEISQVRARTRTWSLLLRRAAHSRAGAVRPESVGAFFFRLQYVREITEQLMKAKLLKGIQSVNQVPTRYWKTTARKNRPNQRDFVSAREISFADCRPF